MSITLQDLIKIINESKTLQEDISKKLNETLRKLTYDERKRLFDSLARYDSSYDSSSVSSLFGVTIDEDLLASEDDL